MVGFRHRSVFVCVCVCVCVCVGGGGNSPREVVVRGDSCLDTNTIPVLRIQK